MEEIHNAEQIQEMIMKAGFKITGYAKTYFDAMKRAENEAYRHGETPEHGLKTQVLYFFCNCKATTPKQKQLKKELQTWAGYTGYRGR